MAKQTPEIIFAFKAGFTLDRAQEAFRDANLEAFSKIAQDNVKTPDKPKPYPDLATHPVTTSSVEDYSKAVAKRYKIKPGDDAGTALAMTVDQIESFKDVKPEDLETKKQALFNKLYSERKMPDLEEGRALAKGSTLGKMEFNPIVSVAVSGYKDAKEFPGGYVQHILANRGENDKTFHDYIAPRHISEPWNPELVKTGMPGVTLAIEWQNGTRRIVTNTGKIVATPLGSDRRADGATVQPQREDKESDAKYKERMDKWYQESNTKSGNDGCYGSIYIKDKGEKPIYANDGDWIDFYCTNDALQDIKKLSPGQTFADIPNLYVIPVTQDFNKSDDPEPKPVIVKASSPQEAREKAVALIASGFALPEAGKKDPFFRSENGKAAGWLADARIDPAMSGAQFAAYLDNVKAHPERGRLPSLTQWTIEANGDKQTVKAVQQSLSEDGLQLVKYRQDLADAISSTEPDAKIKSEAIIKAAGNLTGVTNTMQGKAMDATDKPGEKNRYEKARDNFDNLTLLREYGLDNLAFINGSAKETQYKGRTLAADETRLKQVKQFILDHGDETAKNSALATMKDEEFIGKFLAGDASRQLLNLSDAATKKLTQDGEVSKDDLAKIAAIAAGIDTRSIIASGDQAANVASLPSKAKLRSDAEKAPTTRS